MKNMKYLAAICFLLLTFAGVVFLDQETKHDDAQKLPQPLQTIIVEEGRKQGNKEEWLEQMHRTVPDFNWRKSDFDFRLQRANSPDYFKPETKAIEGQWVEVGSNNQAGRTLVAELDQIENSIYVASDGGQIWKGKLGSENWQSLTDHFRIPAIHFIRNIHEENFTRLLIGSGVWGVPGVMFSDDGGGSWDYATGLENVVNWGFIRRTVMKNDPYQGIYLLCQEWDYDNWNAMSAIYVSYDLGESFQKIQSFPYEASKVDIWTNRYSNDAVYVLDKNAIYVLTDEDELSFIGQLTTDEPGSAFLVGVKNDVEYTFYGMLNTNNVSRFYASLDDGLNWEMKGSLNFGPFMIGSFAASPVTPGLLYFGGVNAYTSSDYGQNWNLVNQWYDYYDDPEGKLHADIPSFNSFINSSDDEILFINTDGGIYLSLDDAESVINLSLKNLRISQYYTTYTCRFAPQYTHAGAQDQGYQFSDEGESGDVLNYDQVISGDYGHMVSSDEGASLWMVYPGFAMYSPDANNNGGLKFWDFVGSNYQWMPELMADPEDPASVYIAGGRISTGAHQIHLTFSGNQMTYTEEPFDFSNGSEANISAMAYSSLNTDYRYVMTSELDFFYSTDGGTSWTQTDAFDSPGSHYFYGADIEPSKSSLGVVYIGGSGYSSPPVFISLDNGLTFNDFSEGLPQTLVFDLALSANDSLLFAATEVGAYVCKTADGIWYDLSDGILPDQAYWAVDFVPTLNVARFASYGRGIWDFDLSPDVVADFTADKLVVDQWETVQFTDLSKYNPIGWEWFFEGADPNTSDEQNPSTFYHVPGFHDVTLIVHNDFSSDTITKINYIEVLPSTGLTDNPEQNSLHIYPNPATITVSINSELPIQQIVLMDLSGQQLEILNLSGNELNTELDLNGLPKGIYLVKIKTERGIHIEKFIKN